MRNSRTETSPVGSTAGFGSRRGEVGRQGERLARKYLERNGFRIVEANYRSRLGELDLVARDGKVFVFVEVKTRTSGTFGDPAEAVNSRKQSRLRRLAQEYLVRHDLEPVEMRFDVLTVRLDREPPFINHIRSAF